MGTSKCQINLRNRKADGDWQAATSPDKISWRVAIDADPVAAALKALGVPQGPASSGGIFD